MSTHFTTPLTVICPSMETFQGQVEGSGPLVVAGPADHLGHRIIPLAVDSQLEDLGSGTSNVGPVPSPGLDSLPTLHVTGDDFQYHATFAHEANPGLNLFDLEDFVFDGEPAWDRYLDPNVPVLNHPIAPSMVMSDPMAPTTPADTLLEVDNAVPEWVPSGAHDCPASEGSDQMVPTAPADTRLEMSATMPEWTFAGAIDFPAREEPDQMVPTAPESFYSSSTESALNTPTMSEPEQMVPPSPAEVAPEFDDTRTQFCIIISDHAGVEPDRTITITPEPNISEVDITEPTLNNPNPLAVLANAALEQHRRTSPAPAMPAAAATSPTARVVHILAVPGLAIPPMVVPAYERPQGPLERVLKGLLPGNLITLDNPGEVVPSWQTALVLRDMLAREKFESNLRMTVVKITGRLKDPGLWSKEPLMIKRGYLSTLFRESQDRSAERSHLIRQLEKLHRNRGDPATADKMARKVYACNRKTIAVYNWRVRIVACQKLCQWVRVGTRPYPPAVQVPKGYCEVYGTSRHRSTRRRGQAGLLCLTPEDL